MASKKNRSRTTTKDTSTRRFKKKTSVLVIERVDYVDYKDVDLLNRFVSDRAKIRNRRVTGNDVQQQRDVANAIKIAREMALLPYARRVSSQRTRPSRDGEGRYDRGEGRGRAAEARPESAADATPEATSDGNGAETEANRAENNTLTEEVGG
ncbi:hypothetical protein BH20ACT4_BH20ACT4_05470 [soil metagenome]